MEEEIKLRMFELKEMHDNSYDDDYRKMIKDKYNTLEKLFDALYSDN